MSKPERILLTPRQRKLFLNDMHVFGYLDLTMDGVNEVARQVHFGTWSDSDVIAGFMVSQIDEAFGPPKGGSQR